MLLNVGEIVKVVAALMDDPGMIDFDKPYCLPFINLAWTDLAVEMEGLGLTYQTVVTELSNVAANTSDLSAYQAEGAALESLLQPVSVEWKRVGDSAVRYTDAPMTPKLPDVLSSAEGILNFEWRGGKIYLTPSSIAVDLRVRYKAYALDFVDASEALVIGIGNIIAYKTAELLNAPAVRNNPQAVMYFTQKGKDAKEEFESLCIKQKNRMNLRIGRAHRRPLRTPRYVARVT